MEISEQIRSFQDRIRVLFILCVFSEDFNDPRYPSVKKLFKSEIRIQKIDFLLRNPDYFAYELLGIASLDNDKKEEIKDVVKSIFENKEPIIRRVEMERFFFGAYEDIDDVIGFLKSIGFIEFSSRKSIDMKTIEKQYFVRSIALDKIDLAMSKASNLLWYYERCILIKKYFGDLSGTQLKVSQYKIDEYRNTSYNSYIGSIQETVRNTFLSLYNESI